MRLFSSLWRKNPVIELQRPYAHPVSTDSSNNRPSGQTVSDDKSIARRRLMIFLVIDTSVYPPLMNQRLGVILWLGVGNRSTCPVKIWAYMCGLIWLQVSVWMGCNNILAAYQRAGSIPDVFRLLGSVFRVEQFLRPWFSHASVC